MKIQALILFTCAVTLACAQEKGGLPKDGNGLMDSCSVVVELGDSPTSLSSLNKDKFTEQMMKFEWCAGYLQATSEALSATQIELYLMSTMGLTFSGPDKVKEYAFEKLRGACIPEKAPISQLARVLVKWLREHPERLHESKSGLTADALKDAFPCPASTPAKEVKPAPTAPTKR
jgi:hypothetical protein